MPRKQYNLNDEFVLHVRVPYRALLILKRIAEQRRCTQTELIEDLLEETARQMLLEIRAPLSVLPAGMFASILNDGELTEEQRGALSVQHKALYAGYVTARSRLMGIEALLKKEATDGQV